jgi:hypothetical protein
MHVPTSQMKKMVLIFLKNNNRGIGGLNKENVLKMMIIYDLASKT